MIFTERIKNHFNLSDESINLLSQNMEEVSYAKGDIIIKEGQRDTYIYFVEKGLTHSYPQLMQKVSQKELASYLNITPQSLSRIRARRKD